MEKSALEMMKTMAELTEVEGNNPPYTDTTITQEANKNDQANELEKVGYVLHKDLPGKKAHGFLSYTYMRIHDITPWDRKCLLFASGGYMRYEANNASFELLTKAASQSPINLGEACTKYFPEMELFTKFIVCFLLIVMFFRPLHPGLQAFYILLLTSSSIHVLPELWRSASGINVTYGSFNLPLNRVIMAGAVGICLIICLIIWIVIFVSWMFDYKGRPEVVEQPDDKVSSDDLDQISVNPC